VEHEELLSGITTSEEEDSLLATRVLIEEAGDIQDHTVDNAPAVLLGVVLSNLLSSVDLESLTILLHSLLLSSGGGDRSSRSRSGDGSTSLESTGVDVGELREEETSSSATSDATENDAVKERRTTETVSTVGSTHHLTSSEETSHGASGALNLSVGVDLDTTHAVVGNRGDDGDVEGVLSLPGTVLEVDLAEGVLLVLLSDVVLLEGVLEDISADTHILGDISDVGVLLHELTTAVVLAVPLNLLGSLAVEDETVRSLIVAHHLTRHEVTSAELVDETLTVAVDHDTTDTAKSLSSEELDGVIRLIRVNEAGGVDLDLINVLEVSTNAKSHLDTVTSGVSTVGGGELEDIRAVLLEERVGLLISGVTAGGEDNRAESLVSLTVLGGVLDADDLAGGVGDQVSGTSLEDDLGLLGSLGSDLLELLHEGVGDGHTRETLATTVSTGEGVTAETRDEREIKLELLHEPLDGGSRLTSEDLSERVGMADLGGLDGVLKESVDGVLDAKLDLRGGQGTVDTRGSLSRVTTHEAILVEKEDTATLLKNSVSSRETRETATHNDDLVRNVRHHETRYIRGKYNDGEVVT